MSEPSWVPDACTLPTEDRPLRLAEFHDLFARERPALDRLSPCSLRLTFGPAAEAAVRDLTAREAECCTFFDFTLSAGDDALAVDIAVPAGHEPVLDGLTAQVPG